MGFLRFVVLVFVLVALSTGKAPTLEEPPKAPAAEQPTTPKKKTLPPIVRLQGVVDDCCCKAEKVDTYNNEHIANTLSQLTKTEFFKYFKVNYLKPCPFWAENYLCSMTEGGGCGICECKEEEIPKPWIEKPKEIDVNTKVDSSFMKSHNDASDIWCDCDDDEKNMVYINLLLNPERYTGYVGYNATRIWAAIYAENCFQTKGDNGLCLEERTLNRLISGFHGSTTAHICEMYYKDGKWVPNVEMFAWKLGREEAFLKNIYFTYLFLARSISKISDTLMKFDYNTGKPEEDSKTRQLVEELLKGSLLCSPTFDESLLFRNSDAHHLREDLRLRFRNISQIMDCVECETCKIHAKLQMLGIGTALKILLPKKTEDLNLQRNEVIALINTFHKFSESVHIVSLMRERMQKMESNGEIFTMQDGKFFAYLWVLILSVLTWLIV